MKKTEFFWFTGLSGSGKTTVANGVAQRLRDEDLSVFIIDGDEVRKHFHRDLGFSAEDIKKNNDLILQMCEKKNGEFDVVLVPIISPFQESRNKARERLKNYFSEIYFKASLDYVVKQDVKGLYEKAKKNIITDLIGFAPGGVAYEVPEDPDFTVCAEDESPEESIKALYDFVVSKLDKD